METMRPIAPDLSIVVPVFNEVENLRPLVDAVREALVDAAAWELILVDDGSTDRT
ncbi:MAG TPA: glycosyltransferase, partial [Alphaproteobacteria bacterium]|nr:glycosyltransferase [Alphaproteobacteria bacterium]